MNLNVFISTGDGWFIQEVYIFVLLQAFPLDECDTFVNWLSLSQYTKLGMELTVECWNDAFGNSVNLFNGCECVCEDG